MADKIDLQLSGSLQMSFLFRIYYSQGKKGIHSHTIFTYVY